MFDFLFIAEAFGVIDQYFHEETFDQDFFDIPIEFYTHFTQQEQQLSWFIINPEKLKTPYRKQKQALIVTQAQKENILTAFRMLHQYSSQLPETASICEKLLIAKQYLPPVFFKSTTNKECKIIPFERKSIT